jgi:F0F1-type ATP synthase membrane subunit c/vacuolar-type H+-ATPase subunit K
MRRTTKGTIVAIFLTIPAALAIAPALAQGMAGGAATGGYVGQMSEEQIRQKLAGEGFAEVSDVKKIPVTKYRWTAKATRSGKPVEITIDELGHVTAK